MNPWFLLTTSTFGAGIVLLVATMANSRLSPLRKASMSVTVASMSLILLDYSRFIWYAPNSAHFPSTPIFFLLGPAWYLLIRSYYRRSREASYLDLLHATPAMVVLIDYLPCIAGLAKGASPFVTPPWIDVSPIGLFAAHVLQMSIYAALSWRVWRRGSPYPAKAARGLRYALIAFSTVVGLHVIVLIAFLTDNLIPPTWTERLLIVGLAFALYAPAILFWRPPIFLTITGYSSQREHQDFAAIVERLNSVLAGEEAYRTPSLRLSDVAQILGLSRHVLSNAINDQLGKSFSDLLNEFRVSAVLDEIHRNSKPVNLLNIAVQSGFNSKATFNRAFRRYVGMSPSQYAESRQGSNRDSSARSYINDRIQ